MAKINSLTQLKQGESPKSTVINANFETERLAFNDNALRMQNIIDRIIVPPEGIQQITNLHVFASKQIENVSLWLDENFDAFKTGLIKIGWDTNNTGLIQQLQEIVPLLPKKPTNLAISGIVIDESGDRIIGLTWQDNANNEVDFELYNKIDNLDYALLDTPIQNAQSAEENIGNPYPVLSVGDEYLGDSYYSGSYKFKLRAVNTTGYSNYSNEVEVVRPNTPSIVSISTVDNDTVELVFAPSYVPTIIGYEIYYSFASANQEGFITEPYKLAHVSSDITEGNITATFDIDFTPQFNESGILENQYYFFKVLTNNELRRSLLSSSENIIAFPQVPQNLRYSLNDPLSGGDYVVKLAWDTGYAGNNTDMEIWWKHGGEYSKLTDSTGVQTGWLQDAYGVYVGFNHNIGNSPSGEYDYKIKAINTSGESEFSTELKVLDFGVGDVWITGYSGGVTTIYKTTDYGVTLTPIGTLTPGGNTCDLYQLSDDSILATEAGKIYKSTDYGLNFTLLSDTSSLSLDGICQISNGDILSVGSPNVYKSTDGGLSFTSICDFKTMTGYQPQGICQLENGDILVSSFTTRQIRIYKSTDGGLNFVLFSSFSTTQSFPSVWGIKQLTDGTILLVFTDAMTGKGYIYKSTNGGLTFTQTYASTGILQLSGVAEVTGV